MASLRRPVELGIYSYDEGPEDNIVLRLISITFMQP
jgi:hypothetical protein